MSQKKKKFKDDIETAERNILIVSWLGIFFTAGFIASVVSGMASC